MIVEERTQDEANPTASRVTDAISNELWNLVVSRLGDRIRQQISEEMEAAVQACHDQIKADLPTLIQQQVTQAVQVVQQQLDAFISKLPEILQATKAEINVEPTPVHIEVPRRMVRKKVSYDPQGRPDVIVEEEIPLT